MSFAARNTLRAVIRSNPRHNFARRYAGTAPGDVLNVQPTSEALAKLAESDKAFTHHAARP
jgi:hypothetical protein